MAKRILKFSLAVSAFTASAFGTRVYLEKGKNDSSYQKCGKITLNEAILAANKLCEQVKTESGAPGLVLSVSVDGNPVYQTGTRINLKAECIMFPINGVILGCLIGYGYADVENNVLCKSNTVMRIASISKSMTMAVVAKLWQEGSLSFDLPVQHYVVEFPEKDFNGERVSLYICNTFNYATYNI